MENKCEWCNTSYPEFDKTEYFYEVYVFQKRHVICSSCLKHLTLIENKEIIGE